MKKIRFKYASSVTDFYPAGGIAHLKEITPPSGTVLVTDENIFQAHTRRFRGWNTIVLKPGENFKVQATADAMIEQLIEMEADRTTTLVGVGGGVITDLTGYVASIYLRGIRFGFIPTTLLGMVDASIGGKNGIDVGQHKNMVGLIRQPDFILHDTLFLRSLPQAEWENGFAEVIKHACIRDASMFAELEKNTLKHYRRSQKAVCELARRNALLKARLVKRDEFEKGERRMLNFGHTLGHALEMQYELSHGQAVSIGMSAACRISRLLTGFRNTARVTDLLARYNLPVDADFDRGKVFRLMKMDKKRERRELHYILLERIGKAVIRPIPLDQVEQIIQEL